MPAAGFGFVCFEIPESAMQLTRKWLRLPAVLIAILAGLAGTSNAADLSKESTAKHPPSNEDLRHILTMTHPRLSPDRRLVLLEVSDATADGAHSHLWLIDVNGAPPRQITYSPASDKSGEHSGAWMPDGQSLLFLAKRAETTQLFRLPMAGGEALAYETKAIPLVDISDSDEALPPRKAGEVSPQRQPLPLDISAFEIAPTGKLVAVVARDPETPGEKKQHEQKADAVLHERDPHGKRLYLLDPESGTLTRTGVAPDVDSVSWANRGDRLIAVSKGPNGADDLGPSKRAWMVSVADPEHPVEMPAIAGTIARGVWSPDGGTYYFQAQATRDSPPGYLDLYSLNLNDGAVRNLTQGLEGAIRESPIATDDGVLQRVQQSVGTHYVRFQGDTRQPIDNHGLLVKELGTNFGHTGWVWLGGDASKPDELFYSASLDDLPRKLNTPALVPGAIAFPVPRLVQWTSDAFVIEGLLYLPAVDGSQLVPLIVDVHGGPTGAWLASFDPFVAYLLGQGWAVLRPNPRGSTGYGEPFVAANRNDLGGGDFRDIMNGVDYAIAHFPIDPKKLALIGYSYGGEMAGFAEGKTDRFKAIVSGAPVIDQHSEYGTEDDSWYDRWFYGKPWEHPADAWRQSPLAYVQNAKSPFLLLQGQSDSVDPAGQSREMYRALRQLGVSVELVEYPREDHGPLAAAIRGFPSKEPWHGYDARGRIASFLKSHFDEPKGDK